ncbi:MAG TPA: methyltransferase domain-containing protein [Friedmanniella sp.]
MSERALVFGRAADAYDRYRLGYPDAVADLTLAYARSPVATALEVGAGTGKATALFAGRGVAVTACEPDAAMAALLRRATTGLPVEVVLSTFEGLGPAGGPYDLLFSASAWHWTDPATRWDRTAALVRSGGTVALFGSGRAGSRLVDPALQDAVATVRATVIPDETRATEARGPSGTWWPGSELEADVRFTDVEEQDLPRVVRRTRAEHLAVLGTLSAYLQLAAADRDALLARIGDVLPDEVDVDATVRLHLARRA